MHCRAGKIATASKDCSLVISSLSPAGAIVALHTHSQQHAGAVKCTRWSDDHVLATCGNDTYAALVSRFSELCSVLCVCERQSSWFLQSMNSVLHGAFQV